MPKRPYRRPRATTLERSFRSGGGRIIRLDQGQLTFGAGQLRHRDRNSNRQQEKNR